MKITRKEKGITLVALIITIIVLLILAVVSIRAVTGDGIIQYAKNARDEYAQAQVNEQAQIQSYLYELEEELGKPIKHSGIIPTGGIYTKADGTVLKAGENFPDTVTDGDIYVYGDYKYSYNQIYSASSDSGWKLNTVQEGWGVRVLDDTKQEYEQIIESISGKNITNLKSTFENCTSLTTAPAIPKGVIWMAYIFSKCESLTDISSIVVPDNATDIHGAFEGCKALENISTFVIPEGVTRADGVFENCSSLTDASSLVIPNGVTRIDSMFYGCRMLKYGPSEIPDSVERIDTLFFNCLVLEGNIIINANPTNYDYCFNNVDMTKVTLKGSSTMLDLIGATGLNYSSN